MKLFAIITMCYFMVSVSICSTTSMKDLENEIKDLRNKFDAQIELEKNIKNYSAQFTQIQDEIEKIVREEQDLEKQKREEKQKLQSKEKENEKKEFELQFVLEKSRINELEEKINYKQKQLRDQGGDFTLQKNEIISEIQKIENKIFNTKTERMEKQDKVLESIKEKFKSTVKNKEKVEKQRKKFENHFKTWGKNKKSCCPSNSKSCYFYTFNSGYLCKFVGCTYNHVSSGDIQITNNQIWINGVEVTKKKTYERDVETDLRMLEESFQVLAEEIFF